MPMKDVLLYLDQRPCAAASRDFAISLANLTGAALTACALIVRTYPPLDDPGSASAYDAFEDLARCDRQRAKGAFDAMRAEAPASLHMDFMTISSALEVAPGDFAEFARFFDLSIVPVARGNEAHLHRATIHAALFGSGRPVFVVPEGSLGQARFDRILVCWDGGAQAAHALTAGMPLLGLAREIELLCVGCEGRAREAHPGVSITRHLARHGLQATLTEHPETDDVGAAIVGHARESGADCIVMGAYGHWRWREFLLGGTTRTVLDSSGIPVFMSH
jgi:nucleotide-binding universal stress UspA family protein